MTWQKCPICDGKSVTEPILIIQDINQRCACNGTGIINSETGQPPEAKHPIKQDEFLKIRTKGREL